MAGMSMEQRSLCEHLHQTLLRGRKSDQSGKGHDTGQGSLQALSTGYEQAPVGGPSQLQEKSG